MLKSKINTKLKNLELNVINSYCEHKRDSNQAESLYLAYNCTTDAEIAFVWSLEMFCLTFDTCTERLKGYGIIT